MLEGQVGDVDKLSLSEYMASQVTDAADKDAERIAESNMMTAFLSKKVFSEIELISQNLVFEVDELDFTLSDLLGNIKRSNIQSAGGLTSNISSPAIQSSDSNAASAATSAPQMPAMPSGFGSLQSAVQTLSSGGSGRTSSGGQQDNFSGQATGGISQPSGGYIVRSTAPQMPSATPVAASGMTSGSQMNPQQNTGMGSGQQVQMPSGNDASIMAMIEKHEGRREEPYKYTAGLWTVGVGHMIGRTLPPEWNKIFTQQEIDQLFAKDYADHKAAAQRIPGFEKLNSSGQGAVIDLTFNMGPAWYRKFPAASAALAKGDVQTFANEMQNSAWFKQVGTRGPTIVGMIRGGGRDTSQQAQQVPSTPGAGPQLSQAGATTEAADQAQMRGVGQQISSLAGPTPGPISQTTPISTSPQVGEVPINIRLQNLQA